MSARGELRVDEERAREKLQKFRLANPHFYVLQFVRTASLLGATQIDFDIDADEVKCTFDAAIPSEYLEDFWSRAYGNRRDDVDEALYHLALGLGSAQALEPGFIYVETTDGGGFALILEGRTERVSPTGTVSSRDTTQIYVREKFRFGHLVEFFTSRLGELEEVRAIRERCRFATLRIRVNGAPTSLPAFHPAQAYHVQSAAADVRLRFAADLPRSSELTRGPGRFRGIVMCHSVEVGDHSDFPHGLGALAVVESRTFKTDLSSLSAVEDEAYRTVIRRDLYGAYHRALLERLTTDEQELSARRLREALVRVAEFIQDSDTLDVPVSADSERLRDHLTGRACFDRADGSREYVSFRELIHRDEEGGHTIYYTDRDFDGVESKRCSPVARIVPGTMAVLRTVVRGTNVTLEPAYRILAAERVRQRNESSFLAADPRELPDIPVHRDVHLRGVRARLYADVRPTDEPQPEYPTDEFVSEFEEERIDGVEYRVKGRPIQRAESDLPFGIVFDGAFEPTDMFDDVVRDERFRDLAVALASGLPELIRAVVDHAREHSMTDSVSELMWWWVAHALNGVVLDQVFGAIGFVGEEVDELARASSTTTLGEVPAFGVEVGATPGRILAALGPVADLEFLEDVAGKRHSLNQLAAVGAVAMAIDRSDAREVDVPTFMQNAARLAVFDRLFDVEYAGALTPHHPASFSASDTVEEIVDGLLSAPVETTEETVGSSTTRLGAEGFVVVEEDTPDPTFTFDGPTQEFDTPFGPPDSEPVAIRSEPLLDAVRGLLVDARGDRADLFDDVLASSIRWSSGLGRLCTVQNREILVARDHPLLRRVEQWDPVTVALLASVIYGEVNRHYVEITDQQDREMQARLLAKSRAFDE